MLPPDLRFEPLSPEERQLGMNAMYGAVTDPDVMASVDHHHSQGDRCAIIVLTADEEFVNGWVANEIATKDLLDFSQVAEAIETYDPKDSACFILIRDKAVSVGIGGRM